MVAFVEAVVMFVGDPIVVPAARLVVALAARSAGELVEGRVGR